MAHGIRITYQDLDRPIRRIDVDTHGERGSSRGHVAVESNGNIWVDRPDLPEMRRSASIVTRISPEQMVELGTAMKKMGEQRLGLS